MKNSCSGIKEDWCCKGKSPFQGVLLLGLLGLQGVLLLELLGLQGVLLAFSLRSASSLSFGRGDKAAESGDVDYEFRM